MRRTCNTTRRGLTLIELVLIVTILGILVAVIVPRFGNNIDEAESNACSVNKGNIEVQAQLWYRNHGSWPAADLSDIFADSSYFPDGTVTCPVDGTSYTFDTSTETVVGHAH